jgi:hypothetical protein
MSSQRIGGGRTFDRKIGSARSLAVEDARSNSPGAVVVGGDHEHGREGVQLPDTKHHPAALPAGNGARGARLALRPRESAIFAWDDRIPGLFELPLLAYVFAHRLLQGPVI